MPYEITDESLDEFPSRLKSARAFSGLTQAETARAIGVTVQTILKWEKGAKTIQKGKRHAAASFIESTGLLVAEALAEDSVDPKEYFIGRLATGPAFTDDELAAAIRLGVTREYDSILEATITRLGSDVAMSRPDLDLLVRSVQLNAVLNPKN